MSSQHKPVVPLRSEFAGDAEMVELIQMFVDELPARMANLRAASTQNQAGAITTIAHQLKGAAAGYGYPTIGEAAARIERKLRSDTQTQVSCLGDDIDELVRLCEAAIEGAAER